MTLFVTASLEISTKFILQNVCSSRTNLVLIHYSIDEIQCNRGMVYNG